jgi:hypothetical protein
VEAIDSDKKPAKIVGDLGDAITAENLLARRPKLHD